VENLQDNADISIVWNTMRENIKMSVKEGLGYCESKHKPWFDEDCSKLVV
jgi:hypothetical protein